MLEIHSETVENLLVYFIKDTIYKNNFKHGIVGVSGGLDSAVTLALTQRALGSQHTFALLMPYKLSSKDSLEDGKKICEQLEVSYEIIDISPMGCRTGFYMSSIGKPTEEEIAKGWEASMEDILNVGSEADIPELNKYQCGSYRLHSLEGAKKVAKEVLKKGVGIMDNEMLTLSNLP